MIILNGKLVKFGKFPNNESYLECGANNSSGFFLYTRSYNKITWKYEDDSEFLQLAILKEHLDYMGTKSHLLIHYMPHSRMDRRNKSHVMSLVAATNIIKSMGFDDIIVKEPHSDVTPALLNAKVHNWCDLMFDLVVTQIKPDTIFYPDAGAQKRYNFRHRYAVGHKQRCFETGKIERFDLIGDVGQTVLIVDDMCSKGGTFIHSAKLLKDNGAKKVYLMVSYCENTVFEGDLFDHVDRVYISKENVMTREHEKLILI